MMADTEEVALLGATQHFECQVIGYPLPFVTWYKDDVEITHNPRYKITFEEDHGVIVLVIRNVTANDEGSYLCRAENSEGVASTASYLVVKGKFGCQVDVCLSVKSRFAKHQFLFSMMP